MEIPDVRGQTLNQHFLPSESLETGLRQMLKPTRMTTFIKAKVTN